MRRTGLTDDCLLPTSLTELTGFMPVGIMSDFADDLQITVSERRNSTKIQDIDLFHLPYSLVQNTSLPKRKIIFTGTSNAPCKIRKVSVIDFEKGHPYIPARLG